MFSFNTFASLLAISAPALGAYVPLREYAGESFFDNWDYYGGVDNTTWGNVTYLDRPTAFSSQLTFVDPAGSAIIRVDNTTNIPEAPLVNRPTVRITSKDTYQIGTLIIADLNHIPYGCSVWPSFWTLGSELEWPHAGEIDIIEGINLMDHNQMSVHTDPGCALSSSASDKAGYGGDLLNNDCSQGRGCSVAEVKENSFGEGFANAGGGAYAMQFDVGGINIWFWSRPDIPKSILSLSSSSPTSIDPTTDFGLPSSFYPASSCSQPLSTYFTPQQIVIDITLCGHWAGLDAQYSSTCPGTCIGNIFGTGNPTYNQAYFSFNWIKTFTADNVTQTTATGDVLPGQSAGATASGSATAANASGSAGADTVGSKTGAALAVGGMNERLSLAWGALILSLLGFGML